MVDSNVDLHESSFIAFLPAEMEGESGEFTGNSVCDVRVYVHVLHTAVVFTHCLNRDLNLNLLCKELIPEECHFLSTFHHSFLNYS